MLGLELLPLLRRYQSQLPHPLLLLLQCRNHQQHHTTMRTHLTPPLLSTEVVMVHTHLVKQTTTLTIKGTRQVRRLLIIRTNSTAPHPELSLIPTLRGTTTNQLRVHLRRMPRNPTKPLRKRLLLQQRFPRATPVSSQTPSSHNHSVPSRILC